MYTELHTLGRWETLRLILTLLLEGRWLGTRPYSRINEMTDSSQPVTVYKARKGSWT
jgi:hypothetical protein